MSTKPGVAFSFLLLQCIPETFTTDYRIHWNSHPLRPESVESTYFLHKVNNKSHKKSTSVGRYVSSIEGFSAFKKQTTGDSHYLEVGRTILTNFEKYARVPYDYAAVSDVSTGQHEEIFLLASNLTPQVANLKQQITNLQKQIDNTMILLKSYRIEIECIQLLVDLINKIYEINRDSGSNFKQMEERLLVLLDEESDGYQLVDEIQKEINKLEAEKTRLITNKENL